jgi:hypothetical protein
MSRKCQPCPLSPSLQSTEAFRNRQPETKAGCATGSSRFGLCLRCATELREAGLIRDAIMAPGRQHPSCERNPAGSLAEESEWFPHLGTARPRRCRRPSPPGVPSPPALWLRRAFLPRYWLPYWPAAPFFSLISFALPSWRITFYRKSTVIKLLLPPPSLAQPVPDCKEGISLCSC